MPSARVEARVITHSVPSSISSNSASAEQSPVSNTRRPGVPGR